MSDFLLRYNALVRSAYAINKVHAISNSNKLDKNDNYHNSNSDSDSNSQDNLHLQKQEEQEKNGENLSLIYSRFRACDSIYSKFDVNSSLIGDLYNLNHLSLVKN